MKYLKYFNLTSDYEAYKNGSEFIAPNVSYVVDNNIVCYNPYEVETRIVCTYNITDTTKTLFSNLVLVVWSRESFGRNVSA